MNKPNHQCNKDPKCAQCPMLNALEKAVQVNETIKQHLTKKIKIKLTDLSTHNLN